MLSSVEFELISKKYENYSVLVEIKKIDKIIILSWFSLIWHKFYVSSNKNLDFFKKIYISLYNLTKTFEKEQLFQKKNYFS